MRKLIQTYYSMKFKGFALALLLHTATGIFLYGQVASDSYVLASSVSRKTNKQISVQGQVIDKETNRTIPYARISGEGIGVLGVCNSEGSFSIKLPKNGRFTVSAHSTGYKTATQVVQTYDVDLAPPLLFSLGTDVLGLDEVVVTGTRTMKTIGNSPILTQVISSLELKENDFENIMDALEYTVPGLQFNSDPRGDNIRIQGLENKYILILVDGERLSATPGGPIDFERLSLSDVKQIEIIKGASSALYGSSSIGMTINIITQRPERKLEGWAKTRYSRFNDLVIDASIGSKIKNFTTQTLFYRNSYDGYDLTPETPQAYTKNPGSNMNIQQKLGWSSDRTRINLSGAYYQNEALKPKKSKEPTFYRSNNKTLRADLEQDLGDYNQLKLAYYGDFYSRNTVYRKIPGKPRKDSFKNASSHVQTFRVYDIYSPINTFQLIAGGEFNWNEDFNIMQYGDEIKTRRVNDLNGFAQFDWQISQLFNLIGGFRYTHHSSFGNAYSPKLNIMFSPANWRFRAGYSRGFKAPDATELYSDFMMGSVSHNIGNPNLKAENSNYYYASAEYRLSNFMVNLDIYQNDIDNKIESRYVVVTENGVDITEMRYSNVDKARIRGAQVSLDYYPIRKLLLHGSYAYTDAKDMRTRLQLLGNTKHALSCNIAYKDQAFGKDYSIALAGRWNSKKVNETEEVTTDPVTGDKVQTLRTNSQSPYSLWKLTALVTPWKKDFLAVNISFGVQNLFNYTDPKGYTTYDPGRRFFCSASLNF